MSKATLTNPHDYDLFCALLGRQVAAGESVEITDEQAAVLGGSGVWQVTGGESDEKPGKPKKAAASRRSANLGGKVAEVDEPPEIEKF